MSDQLLCRLAKCVIFNFFSYCTAIVPFLSHLCNSIVIVRNKLFLCFYVYVLSSSMREGINLLANGIIFFRVKQY